MSSEHFKGIMTETKHTVDDKLYYYFYLRFFSMKIMESLKIKSESTYLENKQMIRWTHR